MAIDEKHHVVTDQEYYEALPPNGLARAMEQATEYLEQALQDCDGAYPTKDVVVELITIDTIEKSQQGGKASA